MYKEERLKNIFYTRLLYCYQIFQILELNQEGYYYDFLFII
jgi:hypothetical protein